MTVPIEVERGPQVGPAGKEDQHARAGTTVLARLAQRVASANILALIGGAYVIGVVLFCFLGPLIYPTNQTNANAALISSVPQNAAPSWAHPFGTDNSSFDLLGRVMFGGQADIEVALAAAVVATVIGMFWARSRLHRRYFRRPYDAVRRRHFVGPCSAPTGCAGRHLQAIDPTADTSRRVHCLARACSSSTRRGALDPLREYVQAVRVAGGSGRRIVVRHIIPNAIGTIVVNGSFQVADAILFLATLGYLGLAIPAARH